MWSFLQICILLGHLFRQVALRDNQHNFPEDFVVLFSGNFISLVKTWQEKERPDNFFFLEMNYGYILY